jgi:hypothetical protein
MPRRQEGRLRALAGPRASRTAEISPLSAERAGSVVLRMPDAPNTSSDHDRLCQEALAFSDLFCAMQHPELVGITDGKAVGTYIESRFKQHLRERHFFVEDVDEGNAAKGVDLPGLSTDIKVTSARQPQSSAPFRDFRQKIEGLGYHLMLFVYIKNEDKIDFPSVRFVPAQLTGDFQTTRYLRHLLSEEAELEDLVAYLQDRQVPADESSLISYAEELLASPPRQGYLTVSNALQWRLQYNRIVTTTVEGVRDVRG